MLKMCYYRNVFYLDARNKNMLTTPSHTKSITSRSDNYTSDIIKLTEQYVHEKLDGEGTGHDWWHIHRVRNLALAIAQTEQADLFVVELAALLHDIADWKFHHGDQEIGPQTARAWLLSHNVDLATINHVCTIIKDISFKGAHVATPMKSIEGQIVQDADRLDALGAIGIARCFAYGGSRNQVMYDPHQKPIMHANFEEYKNKSNITINHFYEKLLLLKDRLNTQAARTIAYERHKFMEQFLNQFFTEWNSEFISL